MSANKSSFHVEHDHKFSDVPRGTNLNVLQKCPLCSSPRLSPTLICTDYTATREQFTLNHCDDCEFVITNPQPEAGELSKYYISHDYISHSETKSGLINRLYHLVQKQNLRYKFSICKRYAPIGNWIDYGSGAGAFLKYVSDRGQTITGFEPDQNALEAAQRKQQVVLPITEYGLFDSKVACISMWHVLEHIPNFQEVLRKHTENLLPNGVLIIAVPNHLSNDARYYNEDWAAYDVPRHLWHFSEKDMRKIADTHGLILEHVRPLIFDAFYVSMLSEKNKRGNILMGIILGTLSNIKAWTGRLPYSSQIYVFRKKSF